MKPKRNGSESPRPSNKKAPAGLNRASSLLKPRHGKTSVLSWITLIQTPRHQRQIIYYIICVFLALLNTRVHCQKRLVALSRWILKTFQFPFVCGRPGELFAPFSSWTSLWRGYKENWQQQSQYFTLVWVQYISKSKVVWLHGDDADSWSSVPLQIHLLMLYSIPRHCIGSRW